MLIWKGFPSRKILTSQSCRSINKKEKKFSLGHPEPTDYFSNKIISESVSKNKLAQSQPTYLNKEIGSTTYSARRKRKSNSEF